MQIEVKESELPQAVKATTAKDFAGYKLDKIEKSKDAKGVISFEMQAVKGKDKLAISFDSNGKLLAKEPLKEETEGKEGKEEKEGKGKNRKSFISDQQKNRYFLKAVFLLGLLIIKNLKEDLIFKRRYFFSKRFRNQLLILLPLLLNEQILSNINKYDRMKVLKKHKSPVSRIFLSGSSSVKG